MSKPTPALLLRRWFEEVWNARRLELADELLAPGAILHEASLAGEALVGAEAFEAHARILLEASRTSTSRWSRWSPTARLEQLRPARPVRPARGGEAPEAAAR